MELDMRESGMKILIKEMVKVIKYGLMVHYTRVIGKTIRQMAKED
jgi:hypothetical protein